MTRRARLVEMAVALVGLVGVLALAATVWGARAVPVLTGSMAPALPAGSLVLTTPVGVEDVRPGLVLAFRPPAPYDTGGRAVLHRVETVTDDSVVVATTRGDANRTADPWRLSLVPGTQLGQQRLTVPLLGHALAGGRRTTVPVAAGALLLCAAVVLRRRPLPCTCSAAHELIGEPR